jgi:hypothetical protein
MTPTLGTLNAIAALRLRAFACVSPFKPASRNAPEMG